MTSAYDTELSNSLAAIAASIPVIKSDRRYWFVRTYGGHFFEDFYESNSIGVGYNRISLEELAVAIRGGRTGRKRLNERFQLLYPKAAGFRYYTSQMLKFATEMRKGDIVIIPSAFTHQVVFGELLEDEAFELDDPIEWNDSAGTVKFRKRRRVKWLKRINRNKLPPHLYTKLYSRHIISDVSESADRIDRELTPIYTKHGRTSVTFHVGTDAGIHGQEFFDLGSALFYLTDELLAQIGEPPQSRYTEFKTHVESRGFWQFISRNPKATAAMVGLIGTIGVTTFGGEAEFKEGSYRVATPGLSGSIIKQVLDYRAQTHKMEQDRLDAETDREIRRLEAETNSKVQLQREETKQALAYATLEKNVDSLKMTAPLEALRILEQENDRQAARQVRGTDGSDPKTDETKDKANE